MSASCFAEPWLAIAAGLIEVVVDSPGDVGAEAVAGVIGDPSLVFVLAES